jgi:hypothetical protein
MIYCGVKLECLERLRLVRRPCISQRLGFSRTHIALPASAGASDERPYRRRGCPSRRTEEIGRHDAVIVFPFRDVALVTSLGTITRRSNPGGRPHRSRLGYIVLGQSSSSDPSHTSYSITLTPCGYPPLRLAGTMAISGKKYPVRV